MPSLKEPPLQRKRLKGSLGGQGLNDFVDLAARGPFSPLATGLPRLLPVPGLLGPEKN